MPPSRGLTWRRLSGDRHKDTIDEKILEGYVGTYTSGEGIGARIIYEAGMLIAFT